jgi:uncharacterized membrane-anchored protein
MSRAVRYWAAIVPSFLVVAAIAIRAEWTLRTGREVRLAVRAYDPMDALSGRYLGVPLAIERFDPGESARDLGLAHADATIWMRLEEDEPVWRAAEVLAGPPEDPEVVAVRGTVLSEHQRELWIDYGLGRFFIPQDGSDPSLPAGAHRLIAVVRITPEGSCALADLLVDGEPYADWNARQAR